MLLRNLLEEYSKKLSKSSPTPLLDVEILISHIMGYTDKIQLMLNYNSDIDEDTLSSFLKLFEKRLESMPIAYIINNKEFMGLNFYVDENVLIPRPDTEVIVEECIHILNKFCNDVENSKKDCDNINFLDMCTGSGAIAISSYKICNTPDKINFYAADISKNALNIANENSINLGSKINFIESDLFSNNFFKSMKNKFDIIVSNPPYIEDMVIPTLDSDVKDYEPILALSGGSDGMFFYNRIIEESVNFLKPNGYLIFEAGHDQSEKIKMKMIEYGFKDIYTKKDIQGFERAVIGRI